MDNGRLEQRVHNTTCTYTLTPPNLSTSIANPYNSDPCRVCLLSHVFAYLLYQACARLELVDITELCALVHALRARERTQRAELRMALEELGLQRASGRWADVELTQVYEPLQAWSAHGRGSELAMALAVARMAIGALAEAALALEATRRLPPSDVPSPSTPGTPTSSQERHGARLYADAALSATYTSAHAEFVTAIQSGNEEPAAPSIFSVPNAYAEFDWSDVYGRRSCARQAGSKAAAPLLSVLVRCTNPGARGWNSLLETGLADSTALRSVLSNAMTVSLIGLHPHLHPGLRAPWWLRHQVLAVSRMHAGFGGLGLALVSEAEATKEAVRRMLASTLTACPALHAALAQIGHPAGLLTTPPARLPAIGMASAMEAFGIAADELLTELTTTAGTADQDESVYMNALQRAFDVDVTRTETHAIPWHASWLGRGTAHVHSKTPLTTIAGDLWSVAFRANFIPFWLHSMQRGMRSARLDACQYPALHALNAATQLTLTLSETDALAVQRAAIETISAGILTYGEVGKRIGVDVVQSTNGNTRDSQETVRVLSAAGATGLAKMLAFARVAWLREQVLVVDLGPRTRGLQLQALYRRLRLSDFDEILALDPAEIPSSMIERFPQHATLLHACCQCRRVSNAIASEGNKLDTSFNELGTSIAMLCTECEGERAGAVHIRCAKRSSAALRAALQFEDEMAVRQVETEPVNKESVELLLCQKRGAGNSDSGLAARIRRDAKNALEQRERALACGDEAMLNIPILGRAVRLWGAWYALCAHCAALVRVQPWHRFGTEICCLRCDTELLRVDNAAASSTLSNPAGRHVAKIVCRFCGKVQPDSGTARWRMVKSPLDVAGPNRLLPPPLRAVYYCASHHRAWLGAAHRTLPTRVILSHLAHGAKPINGAEFGRSDQKRNEARELGFDLEPTRKRRRRTAKRR